MNFRQLKVGDMFRFASAYDETEIRQKVSWSKYVDVSNNGIPGNPNWVKKVRTRETKVIKVIC